MSFRHLGYIAELEGVEPAVRLVLGALGNRACQVCGLAWPGMDYLIRKTGLGESTITRALKQAIADGHLRVHRYGKGGRGRTTEYVVCPAAFDFSAPACGDCQERMKTPSLLGGLSGKKPPRVDPVSRGVIHKPPKSGARNPPAVTHHSVRDTDIQSEGGPSASRPGSASPPSSGSTPQPTTAQDDQASAEAFMLDLTHPVPNDESLGHPRKP